MRNFGFYKIGMASLKLKVANPAYNVQEIKTAVKQAASDGVKVLVTPELSVCGYTCGDLFFQEQLRQSVERELRSLLQFTIGLDLAVIVGMPVYCAYKVYNCAVVIKDGVILGAVPKMYPSNYHEFYEKRWFASGRSGVPEQIRLCNQEVPFGRLLFEFSADLVMGVEICEDLWVPVPPSSQMALSGANLIVNLSASDELAAKADYRSDLVKSQSARCICAYAYAGASVHESTTDLVFGGATLLAENGVMLRAGQRFGRDTVITSGTIDVQRLNFMRSSNTSFGDNGDTCGGTYRRVRSHFSGLALDQFDRFVDPHPFVPSDRRVRQERCSEIFQIQAAGLAKRLEHTGLEKCVLGISGGLDSTLALLVCVQAMRALGHPPGQIIGVTMPGFGTTDRTYQNAVALMDALGVTKMEISIQDACVQHMQDIGHDPAVHDITYENTQARERTQILMDLANQHGGILVGTGDLSEMAMGWCTYNGDHMSMYGVNAGVPKTLVRYLVDFVADQSAQGTAAILRDVLDTPVSPELLPPDTAGQIAQKTEDHIGPYELHDFFLYTLIRLGASIEKIQFLAMKAFQERYTEAEIVHWLELFIDRFFASQFKRSCTPDAPKVGTVSLSPRGDWRMPSDADAAVWRQ